MTNKTKQLPHIQICQFCCIMLYFPSSQKFKLTLPFQPNLLMSQDSNSQESDKSHRDESWVNLIYGVVSQDKWVKSRWLKSWIESGLLTWVNKFPFNHVISAKSVINDTFFTLVHEKCISSFPDMLLSWFACWLGENSPTFNVWVTFICTLFIVLTNIIESILMTFSLRVLGLRFGGLRLASNVYIRKIWLPSFA